MADLRTLVVDLMRYIALEAEPSRKSISPKVALELLQRTEALADALTRHDLAEALRQYKAPPRKRGRKPKANPSTAENTAKRNCGRPSKRTLSDCEEMVRNLESLKVQIRAERNVERVTDKAALEYVITKAAKARNESVTRSLAEYLAPWQKDFSACKTKIGKFQKK